MFFYFFRDTWVCSPAFMWILEVINLYYLFFYISYQWKDWNRRSKERGGRWSPRRLWKLKCPQVFFFFFFFAGPYLQWRWLSSVLLTCCLFYSILIVSSSAPISSGGAESRHASLAHLFPIYLILLWIFTIAPRLNIFPNNNREIINNKLFLLCILS